MANDEQFDRFKELAEECKRIDNESPKIIVICGMGGGKSFYNAMILEKIRENAQNRMNELQNKLNENMVIFDESETIKISPTVIHLPKQKKIAQWKQKRYGLR